MPIAVLSPSPFRCCPCPRNGGHWSLCMRFALILAAGLLSGASGALAAQAPQGTALGSVRVTVRDVTGLPLAGAVVALTPAAGPAVTASTNDRGEALFEKVSQGSYSARVETAGFAPVDRPNVAVRGGRRTDVSVELQLAGIEEQVEVVPEPADEPFTSVLTAEQIQSLPDDPTELAQVLEQLVGATDLDIRVNGFSGGELPAGGRIQEVRVRWDGGADGRGEGPRVEIRTQPGSDGWRNRVNFGLRDERLNARNAYSRERASGQTRQYGWTISGPLVPNRTGISLTIDRSESFEQQAIRAAQPDGRVLGAGPAAIEAAWLLGRDRARPQPAAGTAVGSACQQQRAAQPGRQRVRPAGARLLARSGRRPAAHGLSRDVSAALREQPSTAIRMAEQRHPFAERSDWRSGCSTRSPPAARRSTEPADRASSHSKTSWSSRSAPHTR